MRKVLEDSFFQAGVESRGLVYGYLLNPKPETLKLRWV